MHEHEPKRSLEESSSQNLADEAYILQLLEAILKDREERARRPKGWLERVISTFKENKNAVISFDEIAQHFSSPRSAQNALSQVNEILRGYGLEIEHIPSYRIRRIKD